MRNITAAFIVFFGGFIIMVLEIIGARFLGRFFGPNFYVWISQIGVILIALALGYYLGGIFADYFKRAAFLVFLLVPVGIYTFCVPYFAPPLMDALVMRHPLDIDIPLIWQKLDPAAGSAIFFLPPCFALAILSPYMIRLGSRHLSHVGRISGLIYAYSTIGSIAGVFISGYLLIDIMQISSIIRLMGVMTVVLGFCCLLYDFLFKSIGYDEK